MKHQKGEWIYLTLAVVTGLSVSSIYLNQTILGILGNSFSVPPSKIGFMSTLTQLGYAAGILFLVPLGDIVSKKKLVLIKMTFLSFSLLALGLSNDLTLLLITSLAVGLFASVTQDLVPIAAEMAAPEERGRRIGTVMAGLLIGILVSRTLSGIIESYFGWRWVFWVFAIVIFAFTFVVYLLIPNLKPISHASYRATLGNLFLLLRTERKLTEAILTHGFVGLAFSGFWTNLSFYAAGSPFNYTSAQVGFFGLAGAAGALFAPIAGRFSDKEGPRFGVRMGVSLVVFSFLLLLLVPNSLIALIIAVILFDTGTQVSLVSNQSIVYSLNPKARSSLNALFVTGMFISFSVGSAISSQILNYFGWVGVVIFCFGASLIALARAVYFCK